jgi:hypothetical protein
MGGKTVGIAPAKSKEPGNTYYWGVEEGLHQNLAKLSDSCVMWTSRPILHSLEFLKQVIKREEICYTSLASGTS